jgi:hypothetical protein
MQLLSDAHVTHVSYILILYSVAFLLFLFVNMLIHLYAVHAWQQTKKNDAEAPRANGNGAPNGHVRVRDAEEFELQGLMSDDEEPATPSTPGVVRKERELGER